MTARIPSALIAKIEARVASPCEIERVYDRALSVRLTGPHGSEVIDLVAVALEDHRRRELWELLAEALDAHAR